MRGTIFEVRNRRHPPNPEMALKRQSICFGVRKRQLPPNSQLKLHFSTPKGVSFALTLVVFLLLTSCQPAREPAQPPPNTTPTPTQDGATVNLPDATYEIVKPTLEQQDELGRTLWKLQAQALRAETRDSQAQGTLTQVRGWLYRNGKPVLEFTAPYARANSETREVEAWGGVVAASKTNDARLVAGRILWQARKDRIRASEGVRLQWGAFELRERALHVDTALERAWSGD